MNAAVKFLAPMALLGAMVVTAAIPAMAQNASHAPVNARVREQDKRINQGVRNHDLNRYQAHNLRARDAHIAAVAHRDRVRNGGHLTAGEHRNIEHRLNHDSRTIYRDKHNVH